MNSHSWGILVSTEPIPLYKFSLTENGLLFIIKAEQKGISIMFVKQLVHFPIHLTEHENVSEETDTEREGKR